MTKLSFALTAWIGLAAIVRAEEPANFDAIDIDTNVGIGYGVAVADMNADGRLDVVLVDKENVAWYRNPDWAKFEIVGKLTPRDHVCVAARDIDGDGRAEVAVGAEWNPGDTVKSGSVHYMIPTSDRRGSWHPVALPHEPTVHRMRWVRTGTSAWGILVVPLHGRGNRGGEGVGVRTWIYHPPANGSPRAPWRQELVSWQLHMTHNADPVQWDGDPEDEILIASREGVFLFDATGDRWSRRQLSAGAASEVRAGRLADGRRMLVTIEPFHGNRVVAYVPSATDANGLWSERELDATLKGGHAVACGDLLGTGGDQVAVGWRQSDAKGEVGVRLYVPNRDGSEWRVLRVDRNEMACEDLRLADFDGDGRLDIVAAGRATKNLRIYYNRP